MTQTVKNNLWKGVQSVGVGVIIFFLNGILTYQKKTYDWQIKMEGRMQNMEQSAAIQADLISKRQEYEHLNDLEASQHEKQITFLFAHFGLPLIPN